MSSRKEVLIPSVVAAMLAMALPSLAGSGSEDQANSFAVCNVRVFDGERSLDGQTVVVREGRIVAVGARIGVPTGLRAIDGSGKTLLPGLIDAHVHAWGDAQRDALRFGVTSALDMLGEAQRLPALRRQRDSLAPTTQADLWSAGHGVTAPGGHGTQFGIKVPTLAADGDAAGFVQARLAEGSDYIKLIVEDMSVYGAGKPGGRPRWPTITTAQLQDGITAAHAGRRKAVVHVARQVDGEAAINAGADGLVHLFIDVPADASFVNAARKRGAFVVPTLSVLASLSGAGEGRRLGADPRLQPLLTDAQSAALKTDFPMRKPQSVHLANALKSVGALHLAGVSILAGTDAGNPGTAHGASMHGELELLVRAGLTPSQALTAATAAPARQFGLPDRGRIAAGQRADLLLVDGDPTRDITATRSIDTVWKNGYAIERGLAKAAVVAAAAPAPVVASSEVLVSDFDGSVIDSRFGAGWLPTTDQIAGGGSTVTHALVAGGLKGSTGVLRVAGEIKPGFNYPWAGVMFFPASQPMQPVDLSARRELVFQVRGDGRSYQAMLFSGPSMQGMPSTQGFIAGKEWQQVHLPLAGFNGADLAKTRAITFAATKPEGGFAFEIDNVELR